MASSVTGDEGAPGWTEAVVVEGETSVVRLVAPERSTVVGTVTEGGRPLPGARVELLSSKEEDEGLPMDLFGGGPGDATGPKGEFRVNDVEVGKYSVQITHGSRSMTWTGELDVRSGENRFDVDLPVAILEGTVTGPDGKPLAGVRVQAERAPDDGPEGRSVQRRVMAVFATDDGDGPEMSFGGGPPTPTVLTDAEGRYRLRGVLPDVDLIVKAKAPDVQPGRSERVRVAADQTKSNVDVRLETGGTMEVTLVRPTGTPANSCMVVATWDGTGDVEPRSEFSGPKGVVKLSGLKPGRWRVRVEAFGAAPVGGERSTIPEQTIEVVAGQTARPRFEVP
ncbi:MAG: carboxypeptidase regulatory-like domain-containing protein [Planctomycetes bacterium]|nr:carboxypeptidase regulatory-like domain-containing protein [Planctomycetota bacterium]